MVQHDNRPAATPAPAASTAPVQDLNASFSFDRGAPVASESAGHVAMARGGITSFSSPVAPGSETTFAAVDLGAQSRYQPGTDSDAGGRAMARGAITSVQSRAGEEIAIAA